MAPAPRGKNFIFSRYFLNKLRKWVDGVSVKCQGISIATQPLSLLITLGIDIPRRPLLTTDVCNYANNRSHIAWPQSIVNLRGGTCRPLRRLLCRRRDSRFAMGPVTRIERRPALFHRPAPDRRQITVYNGCRGVSMRHSTFATIAVCRSGVLLALLKRNAYEPALHLYNKNNITWRVFNIFA